ncbi:hypothetical protein ACQ9BO_21300 [Flavobacterium sp. P21]
MPPALAGGLKFELQKALAKLFIWLKPFLFENQLPPAEAGGN